jgi:nucleoside-diphosphate-sugar epimerase
VSVLLVANRGEIARRIFRTARRMRIRTVAVCSDADAALPFVREADAAIRLGGAPARESYLDAERLIAAAREAGAKRAVHTSTFDVFHAETGGTVSEAAVADYPKGTAYERSKQRAEELVLDQAEGGIELVIVNPASVYGPGPWQGTGLDRAIRDAIRRRLPAVPPGGLTLVHADDVAAGHLAAFDRGKPGERYLLTDGYATMRELLSVAVAEAGRGWVPPTLPVPLAKAMATTGEAVSRLIRRPPLLGAGQLHFLLWQARADSSKARTELGVEFTPWEEGIRSTVRWMIDEGRV